MSAPATMAAWFICRAGKITDDVILPFRAGIPIPSEEVAFKQGRMRAARRFKRWHGLHPSTRVSVELQAIGPEAALRNP